MLKDQREIQRKLRILRYAVDISHVAKACRYFGIGRAQAILNKRERIKRKTLEARRLQHRKIAA